MKNFTLPAIPATLSNTNFRTEKHGEEEVVRADLDFIIHAIDSEWLASMATTGKKKEWSNRYKELIFMGGVVDLAGTQDLGDHCISKIEFDRDFEKHNLVFGVADNEQEKGMEIVFHDVKVCKFKAILNKGKGSELKFQVQLDPLHHADDIVKWIQQQVMISIDATKILEAVS